MNRVRTYGRWGRLARGLMPLLALVAFPATAAADPEPTTVVKLPPPPSVVNPCTGETVFLTGEETFGFHISFDTVGGLHVKLSLEARGLKGTTLTGKTYTGYQTIEDEVQVPLGATEETAELEVILIRQGEDGTFVLGDDFKLKNFFHFTVNAQGDLTSLHVTYEPKCQ